MSAIYQNADQLIGSTPLLQLNNYCALNNIKVNIMAKLEYLNPCGSVKDRAAKSMLDDAEVHSLLKPGGTVIEPTSGNTGVGLAAEGARRGYQVILTMPDTMSIERRLLLKAYGAKIVLTPGSQGMQGAVEKAKQLAAAIENSFIPDQFGNAANPQVHFDTTGPEIWRDTDGKVDIFVAGIGTGGTLSGTGRYLKQQTREIQIIGVEPADSPLLTQGHAGSHKLQGIGANFIPAVLEQNIYDQIITVGTQDAFSACRQLARSEGILTGISSGAALHAARTLAEKPGNAQKNIVVILPDGGERYLSTPLYNDGV